VRASSKVGRKLFFARKHWKKILPQTKIKFWGLTYFHTLGLETDVMIQKIFLAKQSAKILAFLLSSFFFKKFDQNISF
jgi:hypothetical protein